ncbi:arginine exporter protein ArgO [Actinoplanes couchii]|uniref:Lysine exporter protein (LYSE/YGGA) n=1 Tax=Actinoplanes couchii TaxID=403638 RepID=A0ABQ3X2S2_9ACTN|nr:LysE family transporter [Actinoplanes couchii]MDR6322480.1 arginine exporter protein ArgO [Actinoplanes couchii]GID52713.1 hypothetical protein Aco03nite_011170 [Actinoplanes couchii]
MSGAFLAGVIAGYGIAVPVGGIGVLIVGLSARISLRVGAAAGLGAATADGIYALVAVVGGAAVASTIAPIADPLKWIGATILLALAIWTAWGAIRGSEITERTERPTTPTRAYLGVLGLTLLNPATVIYFAALILGNGGTSGDIGGGGIGVGDISGGGVGVGDIGGGGVGSGDIGGGGVGSGGINGGGMGSDGVVGGGIGSDSGGGSDGGSGGGAGGGTSGAWFVAGAFLASASWQLFIAGGGSLIGRLLTSPRGRLITALVSSLVIAGFALQLLLTG